MEAHLHLQNWHGWVDQAMGKFALAYADQAERDHAALKSAVRAGVVAMQLEH